MGWMTGQYSNDVLSLHDRAFLKKSRRKPSDVRGHHHVWQTEKRILCVDRLYFRHVQRRCFDLSLAKRVSQRAAVDDGASRGINQQRRGFHLAERIRINHVSRLFR